MGQCSYLDSTSCPTNKQAKDRPKAHKILRTRLCDFCNTQRPKTRSSPHLAPHFAVTIFSVPEHDDIIMAKIMLVTTPISIRPGTLTGKKRSQVRTATLHVRCLKFHDRVPSLSFVSYTKTVRSLLSAERSATSVM